MFSAARVTKVPACYNDNSSLCCFPTETLFAGHSVKLTTKQATNQCGTRHCLKVFSETNTAYLKVAPVQCTNGIVYSVDAVLVPNSVDAVSASSLTVV